MSIRIAPAIAAGLIAAGVLAGCTDSGIEAGYKVEPLPPPPPSAAPGGPQVASAGAAPGAIPAAPPMTILGPPQAAVPVAPTAGALPGLPPPAAALPGLPPATASALPGLPPATATPPGLAPAGGSPLGLPPPAATPVIRNEALPGLGLAQPVRSAAPAALAPRPDPPDFAGSDLPLPGGPGAPELPRPEICNPEPTAFMIGLPAERGLIDEAVDRSGARTARLIPWGSPSGMEGDPNRLTLFLGRDGRIERIVCN